MIKIYSMEHCGYCTKLKSYLDSMHKEYEVLDIQKNPQYAIDLVTVSHQNGVPVSVIGSEVIVGFDKQAIDKALNEQNI